MHCSKKNKKTRRDLLARVVTITLAFALSSQIMMAQQLVNDKYKRRQMESMVMTRWGKFIPKWYYILFHNKYRKGEDRRTIWQLAPIIAATDISRAQSDQEEEDGQILAEQAQWQALNRTLEWPYRLHYQKRFEDQEAKIDLLITHLSDESAEYEVIQHAMEERERIRDHVTIIRESYLDTTDTAEAMSQIEDRYMELHHALSKYLCALQIKNKFQ